MLWSLDMEKNYRSGVLSEAYSQEFAQMQNQVENLGRKGIVIPEGLKKVLERER